MSDDNPAALGRSRSIKAKRQESMIASSGPVSQAPSKSINAILETDSQDESLIKYKLQLLGITDFSELDMNQGQKAKLQLNKLTIYCANDNVTNHYTLDQLKTQPIHIKEGSTFDIILDVRVFNDILLGLKYSHILKKMGIKVDSTTEMLGTVAPRKSDQELKILGLHAPAGMLGKGKYGVHSALVCDDEVTHMDWEWTLKIGSDWK